MCEFAGRRLYKSIQCSPLMIISYPYQQDDRLADLNRNRNRPQETPERRARRPKPGAMTEPMVVSPIAPTPAAQSSASRISPIRYRDFPYRTRAARLATHSRRRTAVPQRGMPPQKRFREIPHVRPARAPRRAQDTRPRSRHRAARRRAPRSRRRARNRRAAARRRHAPRRPHAPPRGRAAAARLQDGADDPRTSRPVGSCGARRTGRLPRRPEAGMGQHRARRPVAEPDAQFAERADLVVSPSGFPRRIGHARQRASRTVRPGRVGQIRPREIRRRRLSGQHAARRETRAIEGRARPRVARRRILVARQQHRRAAAARRRVPVVSQRDLGTRGAARRRERESRQAAARCARGRPDQPCDPVGNRHAGRGRHAARTAAGLTYAK